MRIENTNSKNNYLYVLSYNLFCVLGPLITTPYLSRVLGTSGIGTYSYFHSIAYYFTLLAKLGLTNYGTRRIAEVKNDSKKLSEEFTNILAMQFFVSLIVSAFYFMFVYFTYGINIIIGLVFGLWVISNGINIDWFLFGIEKFRTISLISIFIKSIEIFAVFVFIKKFDDVWKYCFVYSLGYLILYVIFFGVGLKYITLHSITFNKIISHVKPCLLLMIPVIALSIYRSMDKVMLGYLTKDMDQSGLYENAEKIIYALTVFISSLGQVMMPRMSALLSEGKDAEVKSRVESSMKFICFSTNAMCFGLISVSQSFVLIYFGEQFSKCAELINILAITLIFIGWGNVLRTQLIIPMKKDNIYIKSIALGAIINVFFNFILIPQYGAWGACIGTLLAELSVPVYQSVAINKEVDMFKMLLNNIAFSISGFVMLITLLLLQNKFGLGIKTLVYQFIIGGCIYLSLCFIYMKNDLKRLFRTKTN